MDPYAILGVSKKADLNAIKRAYRQLAKEHHPDRHPGDAKAAERFKEISAAYKILGNAESRRRYDRGDIDAWGTERRRTATSRGAANAYSRTAGWNTDFSDTQTAEDFFNDIFGRRNRGRNRAGAGAGPERGRGLDETYTVTLDFLLAAKGGTHRLPLKSGRTVEVKIPPGVKPGQQIRLKGQGAAGPRFGAPGDALVQVEIADHAHFTRDSDDIHLEVPVTLQEAVLGGKITVPTIWGDVSVTVPKGANTGRILRLKDKGVPREDGTYGHQYLTLKVVLPDKPDAKLESLVRNWAEGRDYAVRNHLK